MEYNVSSANQTILPNRLKTLVVAKKKGNGIGHGRERGWTGGNGVGQGRERSQIGWGTRSDGGNGI